MTAPIGSGWLSRRQALRWWKDVELVPQAADLVRLLRGPGASAPSASAASSAPSAHSFAVTPASVPSSMVCRPLLGADLGLLLRVREAEDPWLNPTNATAPPDLYTGAVPVNQYVRSMQRDLAQGRSLSFGIWLDDELAGEISVGPIIRQSMCSAMVGYWLCHRFTGLGVMPLALALVLEFMLTEGGLHRVEINVMPGNQRSIRVVEKLGFRFEGQRRRLIHVCGKWEDHLSYALTVEDLLVDGEPTGLVARLR